MNIDFSPIKLADVDLCFEISDSDKLSFEESELKEDSLVEYELFISEDDLNLDFSSIERLPNDDFNFKISDIDNIFFEDSDFE